jgi:hypothetical protein
VLAEDASRVRQIRAVSHLIPFRFVDGIMKAWQRYSTHR